MAAFTAKDPADRDAFMAHWAKILADREITIRTILAGDYVAGYVLCHSWFGEAEISYWLGTVYWGQGIATRALSAFLGIVMVRPLYARVARDNSASRRVLEKCGFTIVAEGTGFASARGAEIEELILRLDK
jgi:RimJ/RimL family protein N-acetyltransferase